MKRIIALLFLFVLISTPAVSHSTSQDCIYKVTVKTKHDPYTCVQKPTYIECMRCIDIRVDACELEMESECDLTELKAKDECAQGKYLSARICGKEL